MKIELEIEKIRKALGLLNSMILSGEDHSERSEQEYKDALAALDEISGKTTELIREDVCAVCWSVGITDNNCVCTYQNRYKTIELEFEQCKVCGHIIDDGNPADTEFNEKQLATLNKD